MPEMCYNVANLRIPFLIVSAPSYALPLGRPSNFPAPYLRFVTLSYPEPRRDRSFARAKTSSPFFS